MIKTLRIVSFLLSIWALSFSGPASAASSPWTVTDQARIRLISSGYNSNHELLLGVAFNLEPGWKVYWKNPGDTGIPVHITLTSPSTVPYTLLWPIPYRVIDRFEGITSETYAYSNQVTFPILISDISSADPHTFNFQVTYGICKDICIPGEANLSLTIPAAHQDAEFLPELEAAIATTPKPNGTYGITLQDVTIIRPTASEAVLEVTARHAKSFHAPDLLLDGKDGLTIHAPEVKLSENKQLATFQAPLLLSYNDALKNPDLSITILDEGHGVEVPIAPKSIQYRTDASSLFSSSPPPSSPSLIWIFFLAFIGGFILNLMPCVLPVLSIKILSVLGLHHQRRLHISSGFICTALGIVTSFIFLASILIAFRTAGMQVGWGFHFQQPYFLVFLIMVLTLFTASMWDLLDVRLPGDLRIVTKTASNPYLNHFLMGCFATLLATPCSAPFLGTASGFALSQSPDIILEIFTVMGIGMALPYLVLALFPSLVHLLPKPGQWMIHFKYVMGLLLALTAGWLLWVLSLQWGMLSSLILLGLCILLVLGFLLRRYQKQILTLLILGMFSIPGFFTTSPLSPDSDNSWIPFNEAAISDYVSKGKVVFVDVTAAWCLTCKVNKYSVLNRSNTHALFESNQVVTMRADWTNRNPVIQQFLMQHQRAGIPFNIVYGPHARDGIILPELLTYKSIVRAIEDSR